jgi:hypothetical protein
MLAVQVLILLVLLGFRWSPQLGHSLIDESNPGAPLLVTGTLTAQREVSGPRYLIRARLSARNVSQKAILRQVIKIRVTGAVPAEMVREDEGFFSTETFSPGATEILEVASAPLGEPQGEIETIEFSRDAVTTAKVAFVEFIDGSTWGDQQQGLAGLAERRLRLEKLRSLASTYQMKGEQQFVAELKETSNLALIKILKGTSSAGDPDARVAFQTVEKMLSAAEMHERALTTPRTTPSPPLTSTNAGDDEMTQDAEPNPGSFLVILSDAQVDLSPGAVSITDCLVVLPDGQFRLEHRRQEVPRPDPSSHNLGALPPDPDMTVVFESSLSEVQLARLRDIVNDDQVRNLPTFVPPAKPINATRFHYFTARIGQQPKNLYVGYFIWKGTAVEKTSPASTPENIKKDWLVSESVLNQLGDWFRTIEDLPLHPSNAEPTQCRVR